ncbi:uncharacterized protein LOC110307529 [Mus caroli]|uniref:Uncharacterized protein LOC110307529 n=1 Tax=Mus caroli TaxID=10089 RepID=A0A6P5R0Z2_MUSCR|nr:uncharacterized protein LOC110307529 [Mus caroli]
MTACAFQTPTHTKVGEAQRSLETNNCICATSGTRARKGIRFRDWRNMGREHRAPACPSRKPSGGGKSGARAPAHRPGSAPRPAARSRPRAEATQSRSPTQRRWRRRQRQQRRDPRGRSARAFRAHCTHPSPQPCCPPAALRWRRRKRPGERQPGAGSAGGASAVLLRTPGPRRGTQRDRGFLGLLPARSGLEGMRPHVLLDRPFCRLRLALPSAAAAILCPGPGLRAAHASVPPLKDLATAAPPS